MKYIHATKGGFYALIIFGIAAILIPGHGPSSSVEITLTVSTFLFAILAGFFMSRLNSRYDKIISLVAAEDSYWLSLYKTSIFLGKKFVKKLEDLIDKYYIVAYGFNAGCYYKHSSKYLHAIYDELNKLELTNRKESGAFQEIIGFLAQIEDSRNKSSVISLEKLSQGLWIVLQFLAAIIIFSIFYLKVPAFYSQVTTIILSTIIILIMFVVRDLQNLRLGGQSVLNESGQETFEFIGRLRYYN